MGSQCVFPTSFSLPKTNIYSKRRYLKVFAIPTGAYVETQQSKQIPECEANTVSLEAGASEAPPRPNGAQHENITLFRTNSAPATTGKARNRPKSKQKQAQDASVEGRSGPLGQQQDRDRRESHASAGPSTQGKGPHRGRSKPRPKPGPQGIYHSGPAQSRRPFGQRPSPTNPLFPMDLFEQALRSGDIQICFSVIHSYLNKLAKAGRPPSTPTTPSPTPPLAWLPVEMEPPPQELPPPEPPAAAMGTAQDDRLPQLGAGPRGRPGGLEKDPPSGAGGAPQADAAQRRGPVPEKSKTALGRVLKGRHQRVFRLCLEQNQLGAALDYLALIPASPLLYGALLTECARLGSLDSVRRVLQVCLILKEIYFMPCILGFV